MSPANEHLLDILSDGSDNTGHGAAFLTVIRSINRSEGAGIGVHDPYDRSPSHDQPTILARYALSGVSSPLARLASDQRYKLAQVKAVFLPSLDVRVLSGLAALLLSLSDAGAEGLVVVGPKGSGDLVDGIANAVLAKRGWPRVNICEVPSGRGQWWKVYEDDYLLAHARCCEVSEEPPSLKAKSESVRVPLAVESTSLADSCTEREGDKHSGSRSTPSSSSPVKIESSSDESWQRVFDQCDASSENLSSSIVYTFTLSGTSHVAPNPGSDEEISDSSFESDTEQQPSSGDGSFSFAIFPPGFGLFRANTRKWFLPLPAKVTRAQTRGETNRPPLNFILHVNPGLQITTTTERGNEPVTKRFVPETAQLASFHFATVPDIFCPDSWDGGVLIRSRCQTNDLRRAGLKCAFPAWKGGSESAECEHIQDMNLRWKQFSVTPLPSCTSVELGQLGRPKKMATTCERQPACILDRRKSILRLCKKEQMDGRTDDLSSICDVTGDFKLSTHQKETLVNVVTKIKLQYNSSQGRRGVIWRPANTCEPQDKDEILLDEDSSDGDGSYTSTGMIHSFDQRPCHQHDDEIVDDTIKKNERATGGRQRGSDGKCSMGVAPGENDNCTSSSEVAEVFPLDPTVPHLLVLGTGCASPSPVRGSSGYALLFPSVSNCYRDSLKEGNMMPKPRLSLVGLIECGEGTLTSLNRYLPQPEEAGAKNKAGDAMAWLEDLRFIWISHGHLDHYSDLPLLVRAVSKAQESRLKKNDNKCDVAICGACSSSCDLSISRKRPRPGEQPKSDRSAFTSSRKHDLPQTAPPSRSVYPIVIAPKKVLHFLNISLQCQNGLEMKGKSSHTEEKQLGDNRLFYGITNMDFERSSHPTATWIRSQLFGIQLQYGAHEYASFQDTLGSTLKLYHPIKFMRSIPVDHCPDAHALILGLNFLSKSGGARDPPLRPFHLCFSGDTRPSERLVRACWEFGCQPISLLIHEATFDDDERGRKEAAKKRHSTVSEAIQVGRRMQAAACMLSHFSGRYARMLPSFATKGSADTCNTIGTSNGIVGCAMDGLIVPLTKDSLCVLNLLDFCIANIFSDKSA